jgi:hypothetical protein
MVKNHKKIPSAMSSCLFYEKPIMAWVFKSNILIKGVGGIYKIKIWILCKTPL